MHIPPSIRYPVYLAIALHAARKALRKLAPGNPPKPRRNPGTLDLMHFREDMAKALLNMERQPVPRPRLLIASESDANFLRMAEQYKMDLPRTAAEIEAKLRRGNPIVVYTENSPGQ